MFKNRAVQLKFVKTPESEKTSAKQSLPSPDDVAEYATIAAYWTKQTAKAGAVLYVGKKVVDTAAEIAPLLVAAKLSK